jgi:hypothetical protein
MSGDFSEFSQCHIWWKYVARYCSCCGRTDNSTARHDEVNRRIFFTNAPKKPEIMWKSLLLCYEAFLWRQLNHGNQFRASDFVNFTSDLQCCSFHGSLWQCWWIAVVVDLWTLVTSAVVTSRGATFAYSIRSVRCVSMIACLWFMTRVGHGKKRNSHRIIVRNPSYLEDQGVDGRKMLKWIVKKQNYNI